MSHFSMVEEIDTDHEKSFLTNVLCLAENETEEQMDKDLQDEARELGIDIDAFFITAPKPLSTRTFSSDNPRRSESIDSRASQSTGITSDLSDFSRAPQYGKGRPLSHASLSFRDYDNFMAQGRLNGRKSMSFSPPSTPSRSTFSLPLSSPSSSPKSYFRRLRGLSMLKLYKTGPSFIYLDGCPHCPQDTLSQRRAVHQLECGHRLCTQALRNTIMMATASSSGAIPSCCGLPIPGAMVERVMTHDEQIELLSKLEQWDEAASIALSVASEANVPSQIKRLGVISRATSMESKVDSVAPRPAAKDVNMVQNPTAFKQAFTKKSELLERFIFWIEKQRAELKTRQDQLRKDMRSQHENTIEELLERHGNAMAEAEDKQVKAEADLREAHEQEKRDNATALKHMEAYCAGMYSTGEPHNRTVTEQDRAELDKTRRIRDAMDAKHTSAINVLRGEQARRMKLRAQRQEREVQELRRAQRKEELELERACTNENNRFDESVSGKRERMQVRDDLQAAILAKKETTELDDALEETFAIVNWQQKRQEGSPNATNEYDAATAASETDSCDAPGKA